MKKIKIISTIVILLFILSYCTKILATPAVGDIEIGTLWPNSDTVIDLGTFEYPTANSLGSVANYAVFSMLYNKNMHMEGTIATAEMNFMTNDAFGITSAIEDYTDSEENFIYIGSVTEGSIENFQTTNQIRTSTMILGDEIKFVKSFNIYSEVWGWDNETSQMVVTGYEWIDTPINNGSGIVFESDGYYSNTFNNTSDVQQSIKHVSETTYVIDFERAFNGLKTYASAQYSKSTVGEDDLTQVSIDEDNNKITVVCTKENMNIINLTATQIENYDIEIICEDSEGNKTQDFSLIINVKDIDGDHTFDRHITVNGKASDPYGETGGRVLWNFGATYSGTTTFSKTDLGMILAPNASIKVVDISHDGSIWAKIVENTRAEIHQNYFKQYTNNIDDPDDSGDDNDDNTGDNTGGNTGDNAGDNTGNNNDENQEENSSNDDSIENDNNISSNNKDDSNSNTNSSANNKTNNITNNQSVKTGDNIMNYFIMIIISSIIYSYIKSKIKVNRYIPRH